MKRRSKVSQAAVAKVVRGAKGVRVGETRDLVSPIPNRTITAALRFSGPWADLWTRFRDEFPDVSDSELLRRAVALYIAVEALDGEGNKPEVTIKFKDENGQSVNADLKEYIGLREPEA